MARLTEQEKKYLSTNLKMLCAKTKLPNPEIAKLCNIPLRTFESYYYGEKSPSSSNFQKLASFFLTTPSTLCSSDFSKKTLEENHIYHNICFIRDEIRDNYPSTIIRDFLSSKYLKHSSFVEFCKTIKVHINYVPIFSSNELEDLTYDEKTGIDILELKRYIEKRQVNSLKNLESEKIIKAKLMQEGNTEKDANDKLTTYRKVARKLADLLLDDIPENVRRTQGLQYLVDEISKGNYENCDIDDLPIRIEVCRISSKDAEKKRTISDYIVPVKTYSIKDFMKLQNDFIQKIWDTFS